MRTSPWGRSGALVAEIVRRREAYLLVLLAILLVTGVIVYPFLYNLYISMLDARALSGLWQFAGAANYASLLADPVFWKVLRQSAVWTVGSVLLEFLIGLSVALLLNSARWGRGILGGLLLVPWITSYVVTAIVWRWMFDTQLGLINDLLLRLQIVREPVLWLAEPSLAMLAIVVANVWKYFPFVALMLLAGLQGIPDELYEAASMDGAGVIQQFRSITWPQLLPVSAVAVLLAGIWAFNAFTIPYIMTGGGPLRSTEIFAIYVYRQSFVAFDFGTASAASVVLFGVMSILVAGYMRLVGQEAAGD